MPEEKKVEVEEEEEEEEESQIEESGKEGVTEGTQTLKANEFIKKKFKQYLNEETLKPTKGYGKIKFAQSESDHEPNFVKVHDKAEPGDLRILLENYWELKKPSILCSVVGGLDNFTLSYAAMDEIRYELVKTAANCNAWVFTEGFASGFVKACGEVLNVLREMNKESHYTLIAVLPWHLINNKKKLNKKGSKAHYEPKDDDQNPRLDPNHTQYIMVDYGKHYTEDLAKKFLSAFMKQFNLPIFSIYIGGNINVFSNLLKDLERGSLCIIVKNSGPGTTVLSYALEEHARNKTPEFKTLIEKKLYFVFRREKATAITAAAKKIEQIVNYKTNIRIFEYDSKIEFEELFVAFVIEYTKDSLFQINIALHLRYADLVEDVVSQHLTEIDSRNYILFLIKALKLHKSEAAIYFMENGANIYEISDEEIREHFWYYSNLKNKRLPLPLIITRFSNINFSTPLSHKNCVKSQYIVLILFFYSILSLDRKLSEYFWKMGDQHIINAMLACRMLSYIQKKHKTYSAKNKAENLRTIFEDHAVAIVNRCWRADRSLTRKLLVSENVGFFKKNVIKMAAIAKCKNVEATAAMQDMFTVRWYGHIHHAYFFGIIVLFYFLPIFIPILRFNAKMSVFHKVLAFYRSPFAKFIGYTLSNAVYLFVMYYLLLTTYDYSKVSPLEFVLMLFNLGYLAEVVRKLLTTHGSVWLRLRQFFVNFYKSLDAIAVLTYFVGLVFRYAIAISGKDEDSHWCLVLLITSSILHSIKLLRALFPHKTLGRMLLIIIKMLSSVSHFLIILIFTDLYCGLFFFLINRDEKTGILDSDMLVLANQVFFYPYFRMYNYQFPHDKLNKVDFRGVTTLIGLMFSLLYAHAVLLNILIAMFNREFDVLAANSYKIWNSERFRFLIEFERRPCLPHPFSLFGYTFMFLHSLSRKAIDTRPVYDRALLNWEKSIAEAYHITYQEHQEKTPELQLKITVQQIQNTMNDIRRTKRRYTRIEKSFLFLNDLIKSIITTKYSSEDKTAIQKYIE